MNYIEAIPAYGRDYKNQKSVKEDWNANKDFVAMGMLGSMGYINKQDAETQGLKVIIRYDKQLKVLAV